MALRQERLAALLYEAYEHEKGGVKVYETALECAQDERLRGEFTKYLNETRRHVDAVERVLRTFDLDPEREVPGRLIVRSLGQSLVDAMRTAKQGPDPKAAEVVACECVTLAETKDHLNWKLLQKCSEELDGEKGRALREAVEEVEDQEDEHLYHSTGWTRELWLATLGLRAVLPPPEEQKEVKTAIGASRAEQARDDMKSQKGEGQEKRK
jgi:rubrerythrin